METWCKNIYCEILELSSLELQRKLWLNENNDTGLTSSYIEVMCSLFDDFQIEEFLDEPVSVTGLSSVTLSELRTLIKLLDEYQELETDKEIIVDPEWFIIVKQAQVCIQEWDKSNPSWRLPEDV
jgi:hypothetical protein